MNVADLIIIGSIGLLALLGLKAGIIRPASGVGGVVLGVILGLNYQAQMAALLAPYIGGDVLPRIAGFVIGVVVTFALVKGTAMVVIAYLPRFKLGMADHVVGGFGGIVVGLILMGTMFHLLSGINVAPTREVFDSSRLAPSISKASLVSPSKPWCSSLESGSGESCNSYTRLIGGMVGIDIDAYMEGMLAEGQSVDMIMGMVMASLRGGSPEKMIQIANRPQ